MATKQADPQTVANASLARSETPAHAPQITDLRPQTGRHPFSAQDIRQLQRTLGNRAVGRTLQAQGGAGETAAPHSQDSAQTLPVAGGVLQRRLVSIADFKSGKALVTKTTLLGRPRSTSDVEAIYTAYDAAVNAKNWVLADQKLDLLEAKLDKMSTKTYWKEPKADGAAFLARQRTGLAEERTWLDVQRYGRLAANNTPLAEENRPVIKLYMEQGVAAPLGRVRLFSAQFSSCSPMVVFNASTGVGGLFHFGAKALKDQQGAMRALCALVNPTHIYVLLGGGVGFAGVSDKPFTEDQAPLEKFFKTISPASNVILSDELYDNISITLAEGGGAVSMSKVPPGEDYNTGNDPDNVPAGAQLVGNRAVDMTLWKA